LKLAVRSNQAQFEADLDEWGAAVQVAVPRALAKLADQAETAGTRKAAEVYSMPVRTIANYWTVQPPTTADEFEASVNAKGAGFPLSAFSPRQTQKGVSVSVKGRRFLIPHAFIATMGSGHQGVFARGRYGGGGALVRTGESFGRFDFGKARLPINELYTFAPPDTLDNEEVRAAMEDRVQEQTPKVIAQELRFAFKGK
jgi:hypothetical protein